MRTTDDAVAGGQEELVPRVPLQLHYHDVPLAQLPADAHLGGPDPDPAFCRTVADYGVLQTVLLGQTGGAWDVLAGRRRVKAARRAGHETIPARVLMGDWREWRAELAVIENEQRSHNVPAELDLLDDLIAQGCGEEAILRKTGMPRGTIRARLKLLALDPALRMALREGRMAAGVALRAARLAPAQQAALAARAEGGAVTGPMVREAACARRTEAVAQADLRFLEETAVTWTDQARDLLRRVEATLPPEAEPEVWEALAALRTALGQTRVPV